MVLVVAYSGDGVQGFVFGRLYTFVFIYVCFHCNVTGKLLTDIAVKFTEQTDDRSGIMPFNSPVAAPCNAVRRELCCGLFQTVSRQLIELNWLKDRR